MRRVCFGILLTTLLSTGAWADFDRGIALYRAGDVAGAAEEWKVDAKDGNVVAAYLLGNLYSQGNGVPQSERIAFNYFMQAAWGGHPDSQLRVALMFRNGIPEAGLEKDYKSALDWFEKAAMQRNAEAQYYLALMHRNGEGVNRDRTEGLRWLMLSAKKEYPPAYLTLADLYLSGDSVAENRKKAAIYLGLAQKKLGTDVPPDLSEQINKISRRLTPEEAAAGRERAGELIAGGHTLPAAND